MNYSLKNIVFLESEIVIEPCVFFEYFFDGIEPQR